jgi:AraC family ethanolamine operon transcriptional activator
MSFNKIIAHDAGELQESVAGSEFHHSQLSPGKLTAELWNMQNHRTSLFVAKYDQALRIFGRTPGDGCPVVLFPGYGKGEGYINGRDLSAQSIAMWELNGEIDALLPAGFECIVLKVPEELLHKVAEEITLPDAELVPKEGPMNEGNPDALKRLTNYSRTLFKKAESLQDTGSTLLSEDAEEDLIADYLNCLVQSTDNPPVDRWRKRYQVARRADEYLRAKLHRPVTVAEVCRELKVSRRLLNYAMIDIYQTPPMKYHLRLRLQHARRKLLTSPNHLTILEIALRSGFANAGYFSIYYKALFGESPSVTRGAVVMQTLS